MFGEFYGIRACTNTHHISESELLHSPSQPTTPFIRCVAGLQLLHDQSEKNLAKLAPILQINLKGNTIVSIADLFKILFPDQDLPFPVDEELLNLIPSTLYNSRTYEWDLSDACTESVSKIL